MNKYLKQNLTLNKILSTRTTLYNEVIKVEVLRITGHWPRPKNGVLISLLFNRFCYERSSRTKTWRGRKICIYSIGQDPPSFYIKDSKQAEHKTFILHQALACHTPLSCLHPSLLGHELGVMVQIFGVLIAQVFLSSCHHSIFSNFEL